MINKTINGYIIKQLIGTGGMADVYYAENSLGFPAAIKVLKKEYSHIEQVHKRFVHEARIMKSLDHKHIRKVMDMGVVDGQAAIIMEYLEGKSLKELIHLGKKLSDSTIQKYFNQCIQALKYTHTKNIIHRDIKPSNIFVTINDEVKLLDFGIAKSELILNNTTTGQTLGTVMYMSPEQVVDPKRVTVKTDIYSLGVTFYHALIGKPPYDTTTGSEFTVQQKIVYEDLDFSLIPVHWRALLAGCLRKKPEDRVDVEARNFDDVTLIDDDHQLQTTKKPKAEPKTGFQKRKWIFYLIGGIIVFLSSLLWFNSPLIRTKFIPRVSVDIEKPVKPEIKDALYYAVSEYERKLNPNITNDQVITKAAWARQNPEQYFAETYNKFTGKNIDTETINRFRDLTGITLDINKIPHIVSNQEHDQFETKHIKSSAQKAAEEINNAMVRIPGGSFMMGYTDGFNSGSPSRQLTVRGFQINKYEVTQEQWKSIMRNNPSYFSNCNRCPVEQVSWHDVQNFIEKLNVISGFTYRLPTEEEWEYAAKGGENYEYSGSNDINSVAWYNSNSGGETNEVGLKKSNAFKLHDMTGNVWEWTSSSKDNDFVFKGGSYSDLNISNYVWDYSHDKPDANGKEVGFRLAR